MFRIGDGYGEALAQEFLGPSYCDEELFLRFDEGEFVHAGNGISGGRVEFWTEIRLVRRS